MLDLIESTLSDAAVPPPTQIEESEGSLYLMAQDLPHAYSIAVALTTINHVDLQLGQTFIFIYLHEPVAYRYPRRVYINWPTEEAKSNAI